MPVFQILVGVSAFELSASSSSHGRELRRSLHIEGVSSLVPCALQDRALRRGRRT